MNFIIKRFMMVKWSIMSPYLNWEDSMVKLFTNIKTCFNSKSIPKWFFYVWYIILSPVLIVCTILSVLETAIHIILYSIQAIIFGNVFVGFSKNGKPLIVKWNGDN